MKKVYNPGDVIWVRLETWALKQCGNPPKNGIAKGILDSRCDKDCDFAFIIDDMYGCHFKIIFHKTSSIVDMVNEYEVDLL